MAVQLQEPNAPHGPIKIAIGTFLIMGLSRTIIGAVIPQRKLKRALRSVSPKTWAVMGGVAAAAATMYIVERYGNQENTASIPDFQFTVF